MSDTPLQAAIRAAFNTKANQTEIEAVRDELRALEGTVLTATDNTAVAYSKAIPTSANLFKYAAIQSYGGRSIVWNQLNDNSSVTSTKNGVTFTNNGDGSWTVDGTATASSTFKTVGANYDLIAGHVYLASGCPSGGGWSIYRLEADGSNGYDTGSGKIFTASTSHQSQMTISVANGVTVNNLVFKPRLRDLTLMFGVGNEPSTVAEFLAMFPNDIPDFTLGEILNAPVNKIVSADSNSVEIDAKNISQAILDLPGYGWSAGTAKNWVDWENKKYHQEVAQVDLGDLNWAFRSDAAIFYGGSPTYPMKAGPGGVVCAKYATYTDVAAFKASPFGIEYNYLYSSDRVINVRDSDYAGNPSDFKAAMAGVIAYYELATPIETDISALIDDNTIEVESGGSMTFENTNGDSYRIPVPSSVVTMEKP